MVLLGIYVASLFLNIIAYATKEGHFFAVQDLMHSFISGALKLYIYEFMTEIAFPVSPVFALAILNALSGIISLLNNMTTMHIAFTRENANWYIYLMFLGCLSVTVFGLFIFFTQPYKLNRTDYDFGRRQTMITSIMQVKNNKKKGPESSNHTSVNTRNESIDFEEGDQV